MKVIIDMIKITERIRKEVTKIDELAENIREHGLITPIAVMRLDGGEYQLLAGLRRIRAMQLNGETEIEAQVFDPVDAEEALRIEYYENDQRENFTYSETMDYAYLIKDIEKAKALERMAQGGKGGFKEGTDPGPYLAGGETRDIIGEKIGMSGRQYDRAKYIADHAPPEIIDELDRGERAIRPTYDELRAKEKELHEAHESDEAPLQVIPKPKQRTMKDDPKYQKMLKEQEEYNRKHQEFEALSPQEKIKKLNEKLRESETRANSAEFELEKEKKARKQEMYHYGSTIESLKNQLATAHERITELESLLSKEESIE